MRIYYAHPISMYGTEQERIHKEQIARQFPGATIDDPSEHMNESMDYYLGRVKRADIVVFSPFEDTDRNIDGRIGAGVGLEINTALEEGVSVLRLHRCGSMSMVTQPVAHMNRDDTVAILKRKGVVFTEKGLVLPKRN